MDNGQIQAGSPQVQQPSVNPSADKVVPTVESVGTMHKEAGIGLASPLEEKEKKEVSEIIKSDEAELALHPEVSEARVEKVVEFPELNKDQQKAGITFAKESTPVFTQPSGIIKLPMTEKEALRVIRTTNVNNPRHWIAVMVDKMFQKLGLVPKAGGN